MIEIPRLLAVGSLVLIVGCAHHPAPPSRDPFAPEACPSHHEATLEELTPSTKMLAEWKEPSLSNPSAKLPDSYRLLWVRTFHNPICLRLEKTGTGGELTVKRWAGKGGYEWGAIAETRHVSMNPSEFNHFIHLLDESCFWNAPFDINGDEELDGSDWTLEGRTGAQYRALNRSNPVHLEQAIVTPWLWVIKHSKLTFADKSDIY